ncbi:uncharacterized protein ACRADG_001590 isoform 2-T2 [Cochliomyia hominivorax]
MASYQIDCGYPTANQFLTSSHLLSSGHPNVQSPLAATTLTSTSSSISPSPAAGADNSVTSSNSDSSAGTLTPDAVSQNSALGSTTTSTAACSSVENPANLYPLTATTISPNCCDNGRPMVTDPITGQTICSCQYDANNSTRLSALGSYPRLSSSTPVAGVGMSVFGSTYPSNDQNPYPSIAVESATPFYTSLTTPYALKDTANSTTAWTSAPLQPSSYYTYDPTFGACGYGASYDLASRRKNATRESTATLKAWLNEHMKNPYPTKGEKIMLAIITKMTLTQVSTWFANARRRLKKENKMTWEPKNRTEDEDALGSDDEKEHEDEARIRSTSSASTTAAAAAASIPLQTPTMPTLKRVEYETHLSTTGGGNGAIGLNNNVANSGGALSSGALAGVGVATDLTGNHHSITGLSTQVKDPYHLTIPQNLQQYSTNFYYTNAAAAAAANQQYTHPQHVAAATVTSISPTMRPQISYDTSLLMPPQHHLLSSSSTASSSTSSLIPSSAATAAAAATIAGYTVERR